MKIFFLVKCAKCGREWSIKPSDYSSTYCPDCSCNKKTLIKEIPMEEIRNRKEE